MLKNDTKVVKFVCPDHLNMSTHMTKNIDLLRVLYRAKPKLRKVTFKHACRF